MSLHAGFIKRSAAYILDMILVGALTFLLYLFPFKMIISKSIDGNYKNNYQKPNQAISDEFNGTYSFLGTTTDGLFTVLSTEYNNNNNGSTTNYDKYKNYQVANYNKAKDIINSIIDSIDAPYDKEVKEEDQFYSKLRLLYEYFYSSNNIFTEFPHNSENVLYETLDAAGTLPAGKTLKECNAEYAELIKNNYKEQTTLIAQAFKAYAAKEGNEFVVGTLAYNDVMRDLKSVLRVNVNEVSSTFTTEDKNKLLAHLNDYYSFIQKYTDKTTLGSKTLEDGTEQVNIDKTAYYIFYYDLSQAKFEKQLPYYANIYRHSEISIIYSLSMFVFILSLYTIILRGQTLGRRIMKIKLVGNAEKEKLNPLFALLHDVPFKALYVIVLLLFLNPIVVMIILVILLVSDFILIKFTKNHKMIRDYLSGTKVILSSNSYY